MKNISIILISIITLFTSCKNEKPTPSEAADVKTEMTDNSLEMTEDQLKNAQIGLEKAQKRAIKGILRVNGEVDVPPHNLVSVSFPLGGYLKNSELLEGMPVKKGQILATLEDPSYVQLQQDYLTAQAKIEFLQQELNRQQELAKENINAGKVLQQVQSDFRLQQILVKSLAEKLRFTGLNPETLTADNITRTINLRSPITGFVSKINVNPGKYLAPTDVLFELVNPDDIHAALTIFEKDLQKIKIGQMVNVTVPNLPNESHPAKIILIGRTLNEQRAAMVHCHFVKEDHSLTPGMFLNADIETMETNALSVPNEAVLRFENRFFVFIARDATHFELVEIQQGVSDKTYTQIAALDENMDLSNQNIVVKNAYALLGKMKNSEEE
jgi:membrane fusion protein, heavy metal efflux system